MAGASLTLAAGEGRSRACAAEEAQDDSSGGRDMLLRWAAAAGWAAL